MSVIIPGMKMPNDCPMCPMSYWNAGGSFSGCRAVVGKKFAMDDDGYRNSNKRPDWCPLISVPPHGRLGDLDKLDYAFTALRFNGDGSLNHWDDRKNWCLHGSEIEMLLTNAPTIIPADGGEPT